MPISILQKLRDTVEGGTRYRPEIVSAARRDPALFTAFAMREEGRPYPGLILEPEHVRWHRLWSKHNRLAILACREAGKSSQMIGRVVWELGRDTSHRIAVFSGTEDLAKYTVSAVRSHIENSDEVRAVFPNLRPGTPWGDTAFSVHRQVGIRDPTMTAAGVVGNKLGARITIGIFDDILTAKNVATPMLRNGVKDWWSKTIIGCITAQGRVWSIGNAWHPDDIVHTQWTRSKEWHIHRSPVYDECRRLMYPRMWPAERILGMKRELDQAGPYEFERQMLAKVRDDMTALFQREWIDLCLKRGLGITPVRRLRALPDGATVHHGLDLGFVEGGDLNSLVTILRYPNGVTLPLWIESGHWSFREKKRQVVDAHKRYGGVFMVESNAAQRLIIEALDESNPEIPVRPFNTTAKSKNAAIDALAASMCQGMLPIPNDDGNMHPEFDALLSEIRYYDPKGHTGDRMMAMLFALSGARSMQSFGEIDMDVEVA